MLYNANQTRQKVAGEELDDLTKELEIVEKAIHAGIAKNATYCVVEFHICQDAVSKLKELGYNVSLNVSNKCTYVSWLS